MTFARYAALLLLLSFPACRPAAVPARPTPHCVFGSPDDVTISAGQYPGYTIFRDCGLPPHHNRIAVIGTGSKDIEWYADVEDRKRMEDFRTWTLRCLGQGHVQSEHATGFGGSCRGGRGAAVVFLDDWREVDAAARALGAGFASGNLRGEVDLIVEGIPVPL